MRDAQDASLRTVYVDEHASVVKMRKARLVVLDGVDQGAEFVVERREVFAGRSSVNDIVLRDPSISGVHFKLVTEASGVSLHDLGSTNGTTIGSCQVREVVLGPQAVFRAGQTALKLVPMDEVVELPLSAEERFGGVIGRSLAMREIFGLLGRVAPSDLTCLVEGATGTGKERVARAIHEHSRRRNRPYVVLDCSSIPRELVESYIFGHEKGAFTGATSRHIGAFEQAHGGTLFLDEIGELELNLQPRLLRVLEQREFKRVGGTQNVRVDCRVIAATNRDLRQMVSAGAFREDLFFRLSVVQVRLPRLAERVEDIAPLAEHFLDELARQSHDGVRRRLTPEALGVLQRYDWPGNVRELKNTMELAGSLARDVLLRPEDIHLRGVSAGLVATPGLTEPATTTPPAPVDLDVPFKEAKQALVDSFEQRYLAELLEAHDGNLSRASRAAGITRYYLRELLKKHDMR